MNQLVEHVLTNITTLFNQLTDHLVQTWNYSYNRHLKDLVLFRQSVDSSLSLPSSLLLLSLCNIIIIHHHHHQQQHISLKRLAFSACLIFVC